MSLIMLQGWARDDRKMKEKNTVWQFYRKIKYILNLRHKQEVLGGDHSYMQSYH
jgi:hypothetical protein